MTNLNEIENKLETLGTRTADIFAYNFDKDLAKAEELYLASKEERATADDIAWNNNILANFNKLSEEEQKYYSNVYRFRMDAILA